MSRRSVYILHVGLTIKLSKYLDDEFGRQEWFVYESRTSPSGPVVANGTVHAFFDEQIGRDKAKEIFPGRELMLVSKMLPRYLSNSYKRERFDITRVTLFSGHGASSHEIVSRSP